MPLLHAVDSAFPPDAQQHEVDQLISVLQPSYGGGFGFGRWVRPPVSAIKLKTDTNVNVVTNGNKGDVSYTLVGDTMYLNLNLISLNIPACATLFVRIPDGFTVANRSGGPLNRGGFNTCITINGGVVRVGYLQALNAGDVWIYVNIVGLAFMADVAASILGSICFECAKGN